MNQQIRIYHDFQKTDDERRLVLSLLGTIEDLKKHGVELSEGLELTFYGDDVNEKDEPDPLVARGVVQFNSKINGWVAKIDWNQIKHESEL